MPGVVFERGDRVALRTVERDDAEFLQRGRNHPEVRPPLGMSFPENDGQIAETLDERVEEDDGINLLVCREPTEGDGGRGAGEDADGDGEPTPVGVVNVMKVHWDRPLLSYWVLPEYQGEGYATEAMTLLLDYFFASHDKHGVQARVFSHNEPSQALLGRLGFEREAVLRENRFVEGDYRDEYVFGLLREEWVEGE
ncbi:MULTISPECIES: GNAT family N-acetyltransferase [Halorussus]|uniref:GNAT family N-acetyltransferase n=1 Tax=Halorussus TaxID=1070314 RepID=UPI00209E6BC0|nr:GNAT family protein [Halorussus vallis]USZ75209.1 GNAT family N-acetyltransferase [Halorussus vallis]